MKYSNLIRYAMTSHLTPRPLPDSLYPVGLRVSKRGTLPSTTWTADNGNGTFSNPLFFEEFSDPDIIRVGNDYYMTGTSMHAMPGLPVLHSVDLVNWTHLCYATEGLDYGPAYHLENGQNIYGQGIWAPCLRYHNGKFYIFSNVNGRGTQVFCASNAAGPWLHWEMACSLHDLSVLFDDDGRVFAVWGYRDLAIAELNDELTDIVPGTEQRPFGPDSLMGEGCHFYKIGGTYFITSAWYESRMRMACARSTNPYGPYEVNMEISADEAFGLTRGNRLTDPWGRDGFALAPPDEGKGPEGIAMHQGGIVDTPTGEWWGFSMMDANSLGRVTCLSPVTWTHEWPYFGLAGNLGRTPRTWTKPDTGITSPIEAPYERSDSFDQRELLPIWQWNHLPDHESWSILPSRRKLRLHALPAHDLLDAKNTLTQRSLGPQSEVTVCLELNGLRAGDLTGLALVNYPFGWIGVRCSESGNNLCQYDQAKGRTITTPLVTGATGRVWFRVECDFLAETAWFSYSLTGQEFTRFGDLFTMIFQLKTFQGIRYGLFCYGYGGGFADFSNFTVNLANRNASSKAIPTGKWIELKGFENERILAVDGNRLVSIPSDHPMAGTAAARFLVVDMKLGRVAFQTADYRFISVLGRGDESVVSLLRTRPADEQSFQWTESFLGDLILLSVAGHRHLSIDLHGSVTATAPGATFDRNNGASFKWSSLA